MVRSWDGLINIPVVGEAVLHCCEVKADTKDNSEDDTNDSSEDGTEDNSEDESEDDSEDDWTTVKLDEFSFFKLLSTVPERSPA